MDPSSAALQIGHYKLLQAKLRSLEIDLEEADKCDKEITRETEELEAKIKGSQEEFEQKKAEMERTYGEKLDEYRKQVKYFESVLAKKMEERESQLAYLGELNVCEKSNLDLVNFDWPTLKKIAGNGDKNDVHEKQYQRAYETSNMVQEANTKMEKLFDLLNSTEDARCRVINQITDIKDRIQKCKDKTAIQQKTISTYEQENYRLTLIIKQCIAHNEPMSEYVTRNVRDKCHSFMNSDTEEELVQGLRKYHKRQDNKIQLLRRKVYKLSHELSYLQVASDQTADLIQHYLTMIHANNNRLLAYNPSRNPPKQIV